eukprot:1179990-Prorocentrum_minimum.AAC.3
MHLDPLRDGHGDGVADGEEEAEDGDVARGRGTARQRHEVVPVEGEREHLLPQRQSVAALRRTVDHLRPRALRHSNINPPPP